MPKVRILSHASVDEVALRALLTEAGCPVEEEVVFAPQMESIATDTSPTEDSEATGERVDKEDPKTCDPEVLVVLLTPELIVSDELNSALLNAANKPCRVLGIWPKGI